MGFRTVVILSNDRCSDWENDPELGKKIARDMFKSNDKQYTPLEIIGGTVVECVHADTQTVAFLDGYNGKAVAHWLWHHGQTEDQKNLEMLKALADKLGYRVSKKSKVK